MRTGVSGSGADLNLQFGYGEKIKLFKIPVVEWGGGWVLKILLGSAPLPPRPGDWSVHLTQDTYNSLASILCKLLDLLASLEVAIQCSAEEPVLDHL